MFETTSRLVSNLVSAIGLAALLAISVTAGAVAGAAVLDVVAPPEAQAHEIVCEQDECERYRPWWPFWTTRGRCVDNPGQETGCNITGKHQCLTYGCEGDPGGVDPGGGDPGNGEEEE